MPHFVIKANLQKSKNTGVYFGDVVTPTILRDVCFRITGQTTFTYEYVDNDYEDMFLEKSYNKGRLAIMQYEDVASYISFSELEIGGRNSSVQSVPIRGFRGRFERTSGIKFKRHTADGHHRRNPDRHDA